MEEQIVKADVLCVGGGLAGLMAAIRARELGAKVVVAEKGNTIHSGKARAGTDHFLCYIPEIHGEDMEEFIDQIMETQVAEVFKDHDADVMRIFLSKSFEIAKLWESWGIPMKYKGKYDLAGHAFPGTTISHIHYQGQKQKTILTEQALKRGVEIMNRVHIFDLLGDGDKVIGAMGVSTQKEKIILFEAKSVFLGTGGVTRLYPAPTPSWIHNRCHPPSLTGDGRVMAYRLGAELRNLETPGIHAGPKYFARAGQGTWVGVLRDPEGKPVGPFVTKPERQYGDITVEVDKSVVSRYDKEGKGPVYMDCRGISDKDYEYMMHFFTHEGLSGLKNYMNEEGIDLRKHPVEFMTYDRGCSGKIYTDNKCATNVKGLYVAGDEQGEGASYAAVFGWIAGENAVKYAQKAEAPSLDKAKARIEENKSLIEKLCSCKIGPNWREVNIALQQIMRDYVGNVRSGALLRAGFSYLRRLKNKAYNTMVAKNQHELGRCLEVLNLIELGELVFVAANARKETKGTVVRSDYPLPNPRWRSKVLIVKNIDGKPTTEWRKVKK